MLTENEFLDRYHHYKTTDEAAVDAEVKQVNAQGIEGNNRVVAVYFPGQGWTVMLLKSVVALIQMGIATIAEDGKVHAV